MGITTKEKTLPRETLTADVAIVGAGPAGLACAIRLLQLIKAHNASGASVISEEGIFVLEKAAALGEHSLSGAILDPRSLRELLGDVAEEAPIEALVQEEALFYFTQNQAIASPIIPSVLENKGHWIVSLRQLVQWLGKEAEQLGANLFTGFPVQSPLLDQQRLIGVRTGDKGVGRDGKPNSNFESGVDVRATYTVVAEGARGSLTKQLFAALPSISKSAPMSYSLGIKEIWQLPAGRLAAGTVWHVLGFPLPSELPGGAWLYGLAQDRLSLGLVTSMQWRDARFDPFGAFLQFKTHPKIAQLLEQGTRLEYGAKAISRSDASSRPTACFPGGLLVGESAGYFHSGRLKGIHLAIKSGMLAAETLFASLRDATGDSQRCEQHEARLRQSWLAEELQRSDAFAQASQEGWLKSIPKLAISFFVKSSAQQHAEVKAPHQYMQKLDGVGGSRVTPPLRLAEKGESLVFSGTRHGEGQPLHLKILEPDICLTRCSQEFGNPCQYFCPAGVYEMRGALGVQRLQIHGANCLHCKTCDILDPYQIIDWTPPEGGDGPHYRNM